jgi:hypothetical protein
MKLTLPALLLSGLFVLPSIPAFRGGWAVVTLEKLPDYAVAGRELPLSFAVRQHGKTMMAGLKPVVELRSNGPALRFSAIPGKEPGRYAATVVIPRAGDWTISIHSGFMENRVTLLPLTAIEPGAAPPVIQDLAKGKRLFVAKGCLTCHLHGDVKADQVVAAGPELTDRHYPVEVIRQILAPSGPVLASRQMPDLQLRPGEISALIAFINAGRGAVASPNAPNPAPPRSE